MRWSNRFRARENLRDGRRVHGGRVHVFRYRVRLSQREIGMRAESGSGSTAYPAIRIPLPRSCPPGWRTMRMQCSAHMFDKSLEKLGIEYFDYYLLHNLLLSTEPFEEYGLWEYVAEKREQGLIRHLGFLESTTRPKLLRGLWPSMPISSSISCSCRSTMPTGKAPSSNRASATRWPAPTVCPS